VATHLDDTICTLLSEAMRCDPVVTPELVVDIGVRATGVRRDCFNMGVDRRGDPRNRRDELISCVDIVGGSIECALIPKNWTVQNWSFPR
jgi:hypothetical protein